MDIRITLLGELGARFGRDHTLELPEGLTAGDLRRRLIEQLDGAETVLSSPSVRLAVDQTIVADNAPLKSGQEVAFLPVYSGG